MPRSTVKCCSHCVDARIDEDRIDVVRVELGQEAEHEQVEPGDRQQRRGVHEVRAEDVR